MINWGPILENTIGSLFGGLLSGGGEYLAAKEYNRGAMQREEQTRQFNRQQWEDQNLYNSPVQQMQRLQEAGLNPNLIYGSSPSGAAGNASPAPTGKAPDYKSPNIPAMAINGLTAYQNFKQQSAIANNELLRGNLIQAQVTKTLADAANMKSNNLILDATIDDQIDALKAKAQQENAISRTLLNDAKVSDATVAARIETMTKEAAIKGATLKGQELKNWYESWKNTLAEQYGLTPNDNYLTRILAEVFPPESLKELKTVMSRNIKRVDKVINFFDTFMNPLQFID